MIEETAILDIIENGIFIADRDLTIRFWNTWLAIHTGITKDMAHGHCLDDLFPGTSFKLLKRKIKIALKLNSSTFTNSTVDRYVLPIELKRITKSIFQYMRQDVVITPLNDNEVSIIIYDTSPLLEARSVIDEQLLVVQKQATTDSLTQCYNRKMFNDLLAAEVKRAQRHGTSFSLIIFDIDNFKAVNDTYGHLVGDEVLKALVTLSCKTIRKIVIFDRWGGADSTMPSL
jgi:GGDEF domain-containing protein